tara:strand:- start:765 stop:1112 length:348 start_codon:yes stop_codon:yes gene_type:complete
MEIEILNKILELSDNKDMVIKEYLTEDIRHKLKSFELFDSNKNDLYISMKIIIISKSTLEIIYEGTLMSIQDNFIRIQVKYKYCMNIPKDIGYIFMKFKKKTETEYYKSLLDSLS